MSAIENGGALVLPPDDEKLAPWQIEHLKAMLGAIGDAKQRFILGDPETPALRTKVKMPTTATYRCKTCCCAFTARTADRARGWARYCSKSCKAIKQTQRYSGRRAHLIIVDDPYEEPPAFGAFHDHDDTHPFSDDAFGPA